MTAPHGSASTYSNHNCRCPECRAAHTAKGRAYNARVHPPRPVIPRDDRQEWRPTVGFPAYEVSDHGAVRSVKTGHLKVPEIDKKGYHRVKLWVDKGMKNKTVSRLVLDAFVGPEPDLQACHRNDTPGDNWIGNLEWGTAKENHATMTAHGHRVVGEQFWSAKLTEQQVLLIYRSTKPTRELAHQFNVSYGTIQEIRGGKTWRWLTAT